MADRMSRMWAPVAATGYVLNAGAILSVSVTSILEAALDREVRQWTVTRFVGRLQLVSENETFYMWGMRVENENVPLGSVEPMGDSTADWILHGGATVVSGWDGISDSIVIDNRSQRKSQGEQSELRFYVENYAGGNGEVSIVGRALLLLP